MQVKAGKDNGLTAKSQSRWPRQSVPRAKNYFSLRHIQKAAKRTKHHFTAAQNSNYILSPLITKGKVAIPRNEKLDSLEVKSRHSWFQI